MKLYKFQIEDKNAWTTHAKFYHKIVYIFSSFRKCTEELKLQILNLRLTTLRLTKNIRRRKWEHQLPF